MPPLHSAPKPPRFQGLRAAAALLCLSLGHQAVQAQIDTSANPNLFFTLTDLTTAQKSYTLNLNLKAADFYINAQQDAGSYLFFTLDPSKDAAFQAFVTAAGASLSTARWGVLGMTVPASDSSGRIVYSTLTNNGDVATQTASYDRLFKINNGILRSNTGLSGYIARLNTAVPGSTIDMSTLVTATAPTLGSSLSSIAYPDTYPNGGIGFTTGSGSGDGDCVFGGLCFGNPVGTSSWFYQTSVSRNATTGNANGNLTVVSVNEFDNLTSDGYWGFARNATTGLYVLSYTLPGSNPKSLVSTDEGRARVSFTDYSAQSGMARLITLGDGDVAAWPAANTVVAVPEPQTWGLMALGGLCVAFAVRRRRTLRPQGSMSLAQGV